MVVGFLYFTLASTESTLRVLHPGNGPSNRAFMAGVPLSLLDAGICWWIFHSLLTTTRTLRLRRLVKIYFFKNILVRCPRFCLNCCRLGLQESSQTYVIPTLHQYLNICSYLINSIYVVVNKIPENGKLCARKFLFALH